MPAEKTLLAHLAPKMDGRIEDTAVEAFGYILSNSPASMRAMTEMLQSAAAGISPVTRVRTQVVGEDASRPDLVGLDELGQERLLVEAKFWAGLTDNQPNGYLERLPSSGVSALLFIAPEARVESLWTELTRLVEEVGTGLTDGREVSAMRTARVSGDERWLMLTTWSSLLGRMWVSASGAGEASVEMDIRQLQGLVESMDGEAFLPLRSEELGPDIPRRMLSLGRLVDDVTERGFRSGWIDTDGLGATSQWSEYGRNLRLFGIRLWFGVDLNQRAQVRETPLWLWSYEYEDTARFADIQREMDVPVGEDYIPLFLPIGLEYEAVVSSLESRLQEIGRAINPEFKPTGG